MKLRMKFLRSFRILFYFKFLFILILASWQAAETLQGCFVFFSSHNYKDFLKASSC